MSRSASALASSVAALLTFAIGCGNPTGGVPVRGNVSYRGETITNASLTFFPQTGRPISTVLSDRGDYATELPPGEYGVVVSLGVELPKGFKEGDPLPPQKIVLPAEYTTRVNSPLKATVTASGQQPIDFALK